jgi:predicted HAD superfamily hydrolase
MVAMIKYSKEFFKKSFTADTMKAAYLSAVKWYSTNVISKDEFANVHIKFVKNDKGEYPTVTIHLFAVLDGQEDVMNKHCEICKEMHHAFFMNEEARCDRCNAFSFQNRLKQKIDVKGEWYKELLRKYGGTK